MSSNKSQGVESAAGLLKYFTSEAGEISPFKLLLGIPVKNLRLKCAIRLNDVVGLPLRLLHMKVEFLRVAFTPPTKVRPLGWESVPSSGTP